MPWDDRTQEYMRQIQQMKVGERLECGCVVIQAAWTHDEARSRVYDALAEILVKPRDEVQRISEAVVLRSLGLDTQSLRKLWGKFFIACDIDMKTNQKGEVEYLVNDEQLPMVPATIGKLVDMVAESHSNPSFQSCLGHLL